MTTTQYTRPDVAAFVASVRTLLADLPPDDRDELLDGLEADLAEQLTDGSTDTLGDPARYAAELRAAAGLPSRSRRLQLAAPSADSIGRCLDSLRGTWQLLVDRHRLTRQAWSLLEDLRPAWWVLRAWVAVTLLDQITGPYEQVSVIPSFRTVASAAGPLLLTSAIVVSALIGKSRWWPGSGPRRHPASRLMLLGLNTLAVLVPLGFSYQSYSYDPGIQYQTSAERVAGLQSDGRAVSNVFAYDLAGNPIEGVQLFDQDGQPIAVVARQAASGHGDERVVGCPWFNGTSALYDVFPLQQRTQRHLGCLTSEGPSTGTVGEIQPATPPLAQVPPVTRTPVTTASISPSVAP